MKRPLPFIFSVLFALLIAAPVSGQCTVDPNCVDIDEPGQYCPETFPPVVRDDPYDQTMTFILPARQYEIEGNVYTLDSVAVDSVRNIPPGLSYSSNSTGYAAGKPYCTRLTGTPTEAGTFPVRIWMRVFATQDGGSQYEIGPVLDDTTMVITVQIPAGFDPYQADDFRVLPVAPNPFSDYTRMGFYTPYDDRIKLQVYNILGELMHEESQGAAQGEHRFEFNGSMLLPGTYFYRVSNSKQLYTGKFIKSK